MVMGAVKMRNSFAKIEPVEQHRRHIVVTLSERTDLVTAFEDPQFLFGQKLNKGDLVDLISPDGLQMYFGCMVKSTVGGIFLGKPLRVETLEEDALYSDDRYAVKPVGHMFAVFDKRGNHQVGPSFSTAKAAEAELHRRYGAKAA